ncbi:GTP-binding protein [Pseudomonas sp. RIT-PI-AD]|uniref:CobW family GTP-binding protein n=1 Tax=Pseudomonas sp. RIT-PI-AD TaxID=3035294 RepID=UPI0021D8E56F|nr:GTP-binding protein [Pseudomonas sp. RIT-PI-AD]
MLTAIPTHLIAGSLGAGKTSLIRHLLMQRPADERWAVLINEFGRIGLDAALLTRDDAGVELAEIAGGCLCCVSGAPFQVGLARLLRKARPQRLLIEPSGLGHPAELRRHLREPPWVGVLALQPGVLVLDAAALADGQALPDAQRAALDQAGLVLLNKSEGLDDATRARLAARLPDSPLYWTEQGRLPLARLPGSGVRAGAASDGLALPPAAAPLPLLWSDPEQPLCQVQDSAEGWSIGWRWHPSQAFERDAVARWLAGLAWRRAKAVLRDGSAWWSANALDGAALAWRPSEWRKDSRLELIFPRAQSATTLSRDFAACRLQPGASPSSR